MARDKLDFVTAFGEALCQMDNSRELLQVQVAAEEAIAEDESLSSRCRMQTVD